jgi:hypothetical protein
MEEIQLPLQECFRYVLRKACSNGRQYIRYAAYLAKYANNSIEDLRKDFKIIELDRDARLSGNPAYKLVYTGVDEGVNLQCRANKIRLLLTNLHFE